jgi:hypothetical protein
VKAAGHEVVHDVVIISHGIEHAADEGCFFLWAYCLFAELGAFWVGVRLFGCVFFCHGIYIAPY